MIKITAAMMSGHSVSTSLPSQSSIAQLQQALVETFGLDVRGGDMHIIFGGCDLAEGNSEVMTLEQAGLMDGAHVDVGIKSWTRPMQIPPCLELELYGMRAAKSSAFTIRYNLHFNLPENEFRAEFWRKNDHDKVKINTLAGTLQGTRQHWMAGDAPHESKLDINMPLATLLADWTAKCQPVFDQADRFWKTPEEIANARSTPKPTPHARRRRSGFDITECKPLYGSPDWFALPSTDCTELIVNATPMCNMTIFRVLLDADGCPIRAALLADCPNHDQVEEYSVKIISR